VHAEGAGCFVPVSVRHSWSGAFALEILLPCRADAQVLPFRQYRACDGLLSNDIICLCQDHNGSVWTGTSDGASLFDGAAVRNLTTRNGLPYPYVNAIIEERTTS
jgi:hypothetical protein